MIRRSRVMAFARMSDGVGWWQKCGTSPPGVSGNVLITKEIRAFFADVLILLELEGCRNLGNLVRDTDATPGCFLANVRKR